MLLLFVLEPGARADITLEESLNLTGANARCSFDVDVDGVVTDDEKDIEPGDFDDDVVAHVGGADGLVEPPETIVLEVLPGDDYAPSIPSTATITLLSTEKIKSK